MNACAIGATDWQQVFAGQVREIQAAHAQAHEALLNWARWTRELQGIYPTLAPCRIWGMGKPGDEYAAADARGMEDTTHRRRSEPLIEVRPDPLDEEASLERQAVELDARLTHPNFPAVWRLVIKAAYCFKRVPLPEHQYPHVAGINNPDDFLRLYDGCLDFLEKV